MEKSKIMKALYFDCFSGISGDMTLGALLDLGLSQDDFISALKTLNVDGFDIKIERKIKNGISANYVRVVLEEEFNHHEHIEDHHHHKEHAYRNYNDILNIIDNSKITDRAKDISKGIFELIAKAEAKVHGEKIEEVHFHEVGAMDSIIDIVGTAILIDMLNVDKILCSKVNDGYGFTYCQHGKIPVPVPAVSEIFSYKNIKFNQIDIPKELVTPTGAAIVSYLCEYFGLMPKMSVLKIGYGAGTRDLEIPNVLRVSLCEIDDVNINKEKITILETNIDDCTPEILGYTMEKLLENGAKDVFFTNIQMKKNRPGVKITVLCDNKDVKMLSDILFLETSTIGIRIREEDRLCLKREIKKVKTIYGEVLVKESIFQDEIKVALEYEDAKKIAKENNVPLKKVYEAILKENL